jgi:hypothetical protein
VYTVERVGPNVLNVRHEAVNAEWRQSYLLMADVHWDNPFCDRKLLTAHLEMAQRTGAGVLIIGDWFCAMQGKYDKRASKDAIRPEHQGGNYLDLLVDTSADYLAPYKDRIVCIGDGNHETSIRNHLETDLLERLCTRIGVQHMGYSGFVRFMFSRAGGGRASKRLFFHHGSGGGGPVTKGVIQTNRRAASVDADIFVTGHIHESFALENPIVRLSDSGQELIEQQWHIQCPTYKQEYDLHGGFHVERGRPPKPLGAWLLTFERRMGRRATIRTTVEKVD